mmetsp:Transcript_559/g.2178  ORF Transcript_559/g.2178 Transcript_559/m.2178 type:complete len:214 (+) Transcript_559:1812-2453(+)
MIDLIRVYRKTSHDVTAAVLLLPLSLKTRTSYEPKNRARRAVRVYSPFRALALVLVSPAPLVLPVPVPGRFGSTQSDSSRGLVRATERRHVPHRAGRWVRVWRQKAVRSRARRVHAFRGIVGEELREEIDGVRAERRERDAEVVVRLVRDRERCRERQRGPPGPDPVVRRAELGEDARDGVCLRLTREDWLVPQKLSEDAPRRPHVHGRAVPS